MEGRSEMEIIKKYKLGMRTFKTGLSVTLGMFISELLNLRSPVFVVLSAIMAMQSSVSESFILGKNRMLSTLVGASLGLLLSSLLPQNGLFLGLGVIIVIYFHNLFNWRKSIALSAVVFSVVFMNTEAGRFSYALNRTIDTFIGIIVSMFVNYFIASPDKETMFLQAVENLYHDSRKIVYNLVRGISIDIDEVRETINNSEEQYETLKQDIDMNFYRSDSESDVNRIFDLLDDIYNDISILYKIKIVPAPTFTLENLQLMQELYDLTMLIPFDYELDHEDIVYNYHLGDLLESLLEIEKLLSNYD